MREFRKLKVWQKAHKMMLDTYSAAAKIKRSPDLSLKNQIVRAAMSVPTNIVEGRAQRTDKEFSRFLGYSIASASELEYHLIVAKDVGAVPEAEASPLIRRVIEVRKMLIGLQRTLGNGDGT